MCSLLHDRCQASPSLAGWPLPLLNGAEPGSLALRLTSSPSEASTDRITPPAARSATGRTSNSPDKHVSSCQIIQTSPDAPTGC